MFCAHYRRYYRGSNDARGIFGSPRRVRAAKCSEQSAITGVDHVVTLLLDHMNVDVIAKRPLGRDWFLVKVYLFAFGAGVLALLGAQTLLLVDARVSTGFLVLWLALTITGIGLTCTGALLAHIRMRKLLNQFGSRISRIERRPEIPGYIADDLRAEQLRLGAIQLRQAHELVLLRQPSSDTEGQG